MIDGLPYSLSIIDAIRYDYDCFRFNTPQYSHRGLFTDGEGIYAIVSEVEKQPELLSKLNEEYKNCRTLCVPQPTIIGVIDSSLVLIEARTKNEKTQSNWQRMNHYEMNNDLVLHIPKRYHPFYADFSWATNQFKLTFKKPITDDDKSDIKLICESLGYQGFEYVFEINDSIDEFVGVVEFKCNTHNNMDLIASGLIQKQFSKSLLMKYEEDEDFWIQYRHSIFSADDDVKPSDYLPPSFTLKRSRCFVDASVFPRLNLRVYLTLYEQVVIALPLDSKSECFYQMFMINKNELKELVARGRLLFVIPQNLARYSQDLLLDILSVDPNSVIFSRQLAASTIQGIQSKIGIVGTTFSSDEQYHFLNHLSRIDSQEVKRLAAVLSEQWQFGESIVNREGATAAFRLGISNLAIRGYQEKGQDYLIELSTASSSYEFAQGLKAHHFPFDGDTYSENAACHIVSSLYNGVLSDSNKIKESELSVLLNDIFTINNDMDILELDSSLSHSLIRSLPGIVSDYSSLDEHTLFNKMRILRQEVRDIERNKKRITKLNLSGFIPTAIGAGMELYNQKGGAFVALGGWLLNVLNVYAQSSDLFNNPIFTRLSSINHFTSHDAIIVQKVRDSVRNI